MEYFKINNHNYSMYVNELKIEKEANYNAQTNAAGDTVVDYINSKRQIEVGIIPLDDAVLRQLMTDIDLFNMTISVRNPKTGLLENIDCILPKSEIEYYTIRADKVFYKAFSLTFTEL